MATIHDMDLTALAKENPEEARRLVEEALQTGGTRAEAAVLLHTSLRTLARAMATLHVAALGDNASNGTTAKLMEWIGVQQRLRGASSWDIGAAAIHIYGEDTRRNRQCIRFLLAAKRSRK